MDGFYGFGGHVGNTWEILLLSVVLIVFVFIMFFFSLRVLTSLQESGF